MKKKLNLLWNLKFNFFSVAERPLTFFAYFLNAKKVGRRRLVIVPATAGGLPLFPHAASVPAPALAPVRSHFACGETGLAGHRPRLLGLPRKSGRGISLRETTLCGCPLRGHGFATPHRYFAVPVTAAPRRGPNGKNPALFGYFLNTKKVTPSADSVIGPAKAGDFPLFPHAASVPAPALAPVRSHFACGETARSVVASAGAGAEAALPKAPPLTLPAQGPASRDFR